LYKAEGFEHNDGRGRENDGGKSVSVYLGAHHFVNEKRDSRDAFRLMLDYIKQLQKQAQGQTPK
jgi:hypothetical protein